MFYEKNNYNNPKVLFFRSQYSIYSEVFLMSGSSIVNCVFLHSTYILHVMHAECTINRAQHAFL